MEIVTLAHVSLNRIGSASRAGFVAHLEIKVVKEVVDGSAESLAALVSAIAVEHGEQLESMHNFQHSKSLTQDGLHEVNIFDVQGPSTFYSSPYAECWTHPALKVGSRYFKLDEVKQDVAQL